MSCIVLIGGIIGCGKTTFVDYFIRKVQHLDQSSTNISKNYILEKLTSYKIFKITFDDLCSIKEQAELMKTLKGLRNFRVDLLFAAEHFINSVCGSKCMLEGPLTERSQSLLNKINKLNDVSSAGFKTVFFVEDNFYYRSMRHEWFQIARRANIGFCQVFLQCPITAAIQRNSSRGYDIPEEKFRMMMSIMELPDPQKYKWEKYCAVMDSLKDHTCIPLEEIIILIKEASDNPAELLISEEKIKAQIVCSKNVIHQADKILRKLISSKITKWKGVTSDKETLKSLISSAIENRQDVLNELRKGSINLSEDLIHSLQKSGIESVHEEYEQCISNLFDKAWRENDSHRHLNMNLSSLDELKNIEM